MKNLKKQIEMGFETFAGWIYRHSKITLLLTVLLTAGIVSHLPKLTVDVTTDGFFYKDDPILVNYQDFRAQFGRDDAIVLLLNPPEIFEQGFLLKLKALQEDLEKEVPYLNEVTSLINVTSTRGEEDELIVEDLLEEWPENESDLQKLKEWVMSTPLYRNLLISEDGRFTTMMIEANAYYSDVEEGDLEETIDVSNLKEGTKGGEYKQALNMDQNGEFVRAVQKVVKRYQGPAFPIYVAGSPVVDAAHVEEIHKNLISFTYYAVGAIFLFLLIIFRRASGILIPLTVIFISLLSTLGMMAIFGLPITMITQILPAFILAVGVGDSVHLLTIFYRKLQETGNKEDSIVFAMGHSGLPMVLTSLTTAGGLLSFLTADMVPVAALGVSASIGVMLALGYTLVLIPTLLSIFSIKQGQTSGTSAAGNNLKLPLSDRILMGMGGFSANHPWKILLISSILLVLSAIGMSQLRFSFNTLVWFPQDSDVRTHTEMLDRQMKSSVTLEVIVDTGKENGLYDPEILNKLEQMNRLAEQLEQDHIRVAKSSSIVDTLKQIHQSLNQNRPEFYKIPQNRDLIAQELLLFENSGTDALEDLVDSQFSKARVTIRVPWTDAIIYVPLMKKLEDEFRKTFAGKAKIAVTGAVALLSGTIVGVMSSMANSYVVAFAVITLMMILLIGNLKIGLISMIPNFLPIAISLGLMGLIDMPLDLFTMLCGGIAIGIAVDDTVHFMHNFQRYYQKTGDAKKAIQETLQTTGRAMFFTTLVLATGFGIFMLASMSNLFNFGLIVAITIINAFLADILLAPALMMLITKSKTILSLDQLAAENR